MKTSTTLLIATLLATAVLTACSHEEPATVAADLTPLIARTAAAESITEGNSIEAYGIVQPARQATVSSRVMGPVVAVHTWAGATVRKGQTLVEIQPETSQGQVAQTEGAQAQAQAALSMAERNLHRYEALHAEKAASEVELDMARMQYEQAKGAFEQASGAVKTARAVAGEAGVTAPFDGRVVERLVEVGDMAAPGRPLVRIESLGGRQIWLTVREADIRRLEIGQELPVTLDSRSDLGTFTAKVAEIMPSADPATHTFTVKVDLGTTEIASGIAGRAFIPGDSSRRIVVPASAVHARGGLELIIVRSADGTARTRAVTTGATAADGRVEILSGIQGGETVVVDAPAPVADGTPIEVRP